MGDYCRTCGTNAPGHWPGCPRGRRLVEVDDLHPFELVCLFLLTIGVAVALVVGCAMIAGHLLGWLA